jgi:hypothetical protein
MTGFPVYYALGWPVPTLSRFLGPQWADWADMNFCTFAAAQLLFERHRDRAVHPRFA